MTTLDSSGLRALASGSWDNAFGSKPRNVGVSSSSYSDVYNSEHRRPHGQIAPYHIEEEESGQEAQYIGEGLTEAVKKIRASNLEKLQQITDQRLAILNEAEKLLDTLASLDLDLDQHDITAYTRWPQSPLYKYALCLQWLTNRNESAHRMVERLSRVSDLHIDSAGGRAKEDASQYVQDVNEIFSWTSIYCMSDLNRIIKNSGSGRAALKYIREEKAKAQGIAQRLTN